MTTGITGIQGLQPPDSPNVYVREEQYRQWTGTDGKYVDIDGLPSLKYNDYSLQKAYQHLEREERGNSYFTDGGANLGVEENTLNDNDTIKLLAKLVNKVNQHELQLGVAVAEGAKTVKLVKDSILTVGGALIDVKHGNIARAAQRLGLVKSTLGRSRSGKFFTNKKPSLSPEDISSRWLELQYGWKPLLNDVYQASKAYEALTKGPRTYYYKTSTKRFVNFDGSVSPTNYSCLTRGKLTQKILLEMKEDMTKDKPRSLGLEDPYTVAWELVPYSFVIDWFIPIGTYIAAANAVPLLKGRWCKTVARHYVCANSRVLENHLFYDGSTNEGEWLYVDRTTGTGGLQVPLPKFKSLAAASSPLHIANAIALVTSRLFGSR
jgi:hypothetical protein